MEYSPAQIKLIFPAKYKSLEMKKELMGGKEI